MMAQADAERELRAEPPRAPEPTRALLRAREAQRAYLAASQRAAARSTVRGLLLLALMILAVSFWRAGLDRVFVQGWWRP